LAKKVAELFRPGPVEEKKSHFPPKWPEVPQLRCRQAGLKRSHGGLERLNSTGKNFKPRLFFFFDPDNLKKESSSKGQVCPKLGRTYVRPRAKLVSLIFAFRRNKQR